MNTNKILIIGVITLFVGVAAFFLLRKSAPPPPPPPEEEEEKEDGKEDGKEDDYMYVPSITSPTGFYTGL